MILNIITALFIILVAGVSVWILSGGIDYD